MNNGVRIALLIVVLFCATPEMARADFMPPTCPPVCITTVTASDVAATTTQDTPVSIQFNGTTSSGSLTYSTTTDPVHGTLGAIGGNTVLYTPTAGYVGSDSFTYKAFSVPVSKTATVTITITGLDTTAPIIVAPATQYFSTTSIPAFPVLVAATATDDTDPSPIITSDAPASFPVGTTTITWTATDTAGNHASTTSDVGITQVRMYQVSNSTSSAETGVPFTVTALVFGGTSSYIPASGAVVGVVLSSATSTIIATSTADASGQATFTVATVGSYAVGLEADSYATTALITITAPVTPAPVPAPTPVGNGPPVTNPAPASVPSPTPVPATPEPTPTDSVPPPAAPIATQVTQTVPTPVPHVTASPAKKIAAAKPAVLAVARPPVETPAPAQEDTQLAAAASATNSRVYDLLGLIIVLLALAGLLWQWKKRRERAQ